MVRDVASIARFVAGTLVEGAVEVGTPVDSVIALPDLTVIGNPMFAGLVVCDRRSLLRVLAGGDDRLELLRGAVAVCHSDDDELRAALAGAKVTGIVGTGQTVSLLLPELAALLAVDAAAEDRSVTTAMRVLTLAARRGGVRGVVAELAHRIDGWVVLLDRHGQVITTAGAGSLHVQDAVAVALGRPVRVRHRALHVHAVGPGEDISARLVVAPRRDALARGRELGSQTAALLDLLLRTNDTNRTERLGRAVMIDALLAGGATAKALLRDWGVHERTLTGFAMAPRSVAVDGERLLKHWLEELGGAHVFTQEHGVLRGFLRDDHAMAIAKRVEAYSSALFLGLGTPSMVEALERTATEARQALEIARSGETRVVRYEAIPTIRYVLARLDAEQTRTLTHPLDALREADGAHGELTDALRVFLETNGSWGATAQRLGVHRQTLAARIRRAEDLTGLSMSSADDRVAAWIALRALQR